MEPEGGDIAHCSRDAKSATLALRRRHREWGSRLTDDTKRYVEMLERYLEALPGVEERRA